MHECNTSQPTRCYSKGITFPLSRFMISTSLSLIRTYVGRRCINFWCIIHPGKSVNQQKEIYDKNCRKNATTIKIGIIRVHVVNIIQYKINLT